MTTRALRNYLDNVRPSAIDSAYQLANKYGVGQDTARTCLEEANYQHDGNRWLRQPTQLDTIERLLVGVNSSLRSLFEFLQLPTQCPNCEGISRDPTPTFTSKPLTSPVGLPQPPNLHLSCRCTGGGE